MNVFVQLFHAVTYVIVVDAGVSYFIATSNWFFLVLCISFLFQGEAILRKIFGVTSAAGTVNDLAVSGLAAYGVARNLLNKAKKKDKRPGEGDEEDEDADDEDEEDNEGSTPSVGPQTTLGAVQNRQAVSAMNTSSQTSSNAPLAPLGAAQQMVNQMAGSVRQGGTGRKIFAHVTNTVGGVMGGVVGATYGLAAGSPQKAVAYGAAGALGGKKMASTLVGSPIRGVTNAYAGQKMKKAIRSGAMDEELKKRAGLDLNSMEKETADLIREALARQASAAVRRGEKVGEYKFQKSIYQGKK